MFVVAMTGPDQKLAFWIACVFCVTVTFALYYYVTNLNNTSYLPQDKEIRRIQKASYVRQDMRIRDIKDTSILPQYVGTRDLKNKSYVPQYMGIRDTKNKSYVAQDIKIQDKEYLVVWYNIPTWGASVGLADVKTCPGVRCRVSSSKLLVDKADAVIVHAVNLPASLKPRGTPNQFWVFFGKESPVNYHSETHRRSDWKGRFNWTMTYRRDSDIPVLNGELRNISDPDPLNFTGIASKKTRSIVWFVSNCHPPSRRDVYVKQLEKYIDVDIYGACGKQAGPRIQGFRWPISDILNDTYKFYLSFENSLCVDYVTEKLFKTYNAHIIPIVRGGFDYKKYIPSGTYINTADFKSPEQLAKYLHYLDNNITAYTEMLERKHRYRNVGSEVMCSVCRKLQNKPEKKTYSDIHDWLTVSGKACHPPEDL